MSLPDAAPLRARRAPSLRVLLWAGTLLCLALGVGSFLVVTYRVLALTDDRAAVRERYDSALNAHHERMVALLEQDLAIHAFADTNADRMLAVYDMARRTEVNAQLATHEALPVTLDALRTLEASIENLRTRWRSAIHLVASGQAGSVALPTLDDVRAAHQAVTEQVVAARNHRIDQLNAAVHATVAAGLLLVGLVAVVAVLLVSYILQRTAAPLEQLARLATDGRAFPAAVIGPVQEVETLSRALHWLDQTARDRREELARAHADAVELGKFGEHVQQLVDVPELYDAVERRLVDVTGAAELTVLVRDAASDRLAVERATHPVPAPLPIVDAPMRCRAVRSLRLVHETGGSATACRCPLAPADTTYLCAPMTAAGDLVGLVSLRAPAAGFRADVEHHVRSSLGFAAPAIASLRLLEATRARALRDPLTGAYNRAFLAEYFEQHLDLAGRRDEGLGVLAIDLDHFKRLNDTYGHAVGDQALVATVAAIQREVRSSDAVVRHGGEELVVILVDVPLAAAAEIAERVRAGIEAIELATPQGRVPVRASIGVAAYPIHGHDQVSLLAAADRALYQAKEGGRNRVVVAEVRKSRTTHVPMLAAH